ncbi:hypothetical protein AHF37_09428 [Paragonimus kellicotti]|nr:hypothetical protein AHF37_09428 [Paragonimus kellicotti]
METGDSQYVVYHANYPQTQPVILGQSIEEDRLNTLITNQFVRLNVSNACGRHPMSKHVEATDDELYPVHSSKK